MMVSELQDAMAVMRHGKRPDLFITMTCNPQWRESQENLLPGQDATNCPDLVARVFKGKCVFFFLRNL